MSGAATPIPAATVILARRASEGFEVYLVRRHKQSGFMADSFVFPGGKIDPGETPEQAAARELLEEAGVLLARTPQAAADAAVIAALRLCLAAKAEPLMKLLAGVDLALDEDALVPWAHWITPSVEPRRFSAHFFVARMPEGQTARHDDHETVDEKWVAPAAAVAAHRAGELKLPPPTMRMLEELAPFSDLDALFAAARARQIATVLPKFIQQQGVLTLLLPWDPEYASAAGEGMEIPKAHALRESPSRIVLSEGRWWSRS